MTKSQRNRELAKALYLSGKSTASIAGIMQLHERTITNYKALDLKEEGCDWDAQKVDKHLGNANRDKDSLFADFVGLMYDELQSIKADEDLSTKQRIEAISKLGDSFSKMRRIANSENPEAFTRTIIKKTISQVISIIQPHVTTECLTAIIEQIDNNQESLADVTV